VNLVSLLTGGVINLKAAKSLGLEVTVAARRRRRGDRVR
jgi:hypothetical protein